MNIVRDIEQFAVKVDCASWNDSLVVMTGRQWQRNWQGCAEEMQCCFDVNNLIILCVEEGCVGIEAGGKRLTAHHGDIFTALSHTPTRMWSNGDSRAYLCLVEHDYLDSLGLEKQFPAHLTVLHTPLHHLEHRDVCHLTSLFDMMHDYILMPEHPYRGATLSNLVRTICYGFGYYYTTLQDRHCRNNAQYWSDQFLRMVENDSTQDVHHYASQIGISRKHLTTCVVATTEHSPAHWIALHRLRHAEQLLTSTNLTIAQIAAQVGYPLQNGFDRFIRRYTGLTPTQLRNKKQ